MARLKYLITQGGDFALFPDKAGISHADIARLMTLLSEDDVTGGGFATLSQNHIPVQTYGESVSARVKSCDSHAELITETIKKGHALQIYVENDAICHSDLWILTNSVNLKNSLTSKINQYNEGYGKKEPISPIVEESIGLDCLSDKAIRSRYHIPSMW